MTIAFAPHGIEFLIHHAQFIQVDSVLTVERIGGYAYGVMVELCDAVTWVKGLQFIYRCVIDFMDDVVGITRVEFTE